MTVLERNDILYDNDQPNSYLVLKPARWTKAVSLYLESLIPNLREIADSYSEAEDFYNNSPFLETIINSFKFEVNPHVELSISGDYVVTLPFEFDMNMLDLLKREVFYSLKIAEVLEGIPSDIVYYLKLADRKYTPVSYIPSLLPQHVFNELAYGGIGDPLLIMSKILDRDIELVTTSSLVVVQNEKEADMYIPSTDGVAIIPAEDVNILSEDDIYSITKGQKYLMLEGKPLHTYYGKAGIYAVGSTIYNIESCN